jgi:hypothetical protein
MKHGYESADNFANVFEYMNNGQHSSSESINELRGSVSEPDSRSNSVTSEDIDTRSKTERIPIPAPNNMRKRETMYNGMSALESRGLTPTPTKYRNLLEENVKNVGSLINLYYEDVKNKISPYNK